MGETLLIRKKQQFELWNVYLAQLIQAPILRNLNFNDMNLSILIGILGCILFLIENF